MVQANHIQQRELRELEKLSQCTFEPEFVSAPLARTGKALKISQALTSATLEHSFAAPLERCDLLRAARLV
jgi:hypothetical protein